MDIMLYSVAYNGKLLVNTTPHALNMLGSNGVGEFIIPSSVDTAGGEGIVNAGADSHEVRPGVYCTIFRATEDGAAKIAEMQSYAKSLGLEPIIIGSAIAMQAYPGMVYGLRPVPGFERVAPAMKKMDADNFNVQLSPQELSALR